MQWLSRLLTTVAPIVMRGKELRSKVKRAIRKGDDLWDEVEEALRGNPALQA